jgi:hypothetical protein
MPSLRAAINAATNVPRLFGAALRAGAGPAGAAEVIAISGGATSIATRRARGVPGRQNAVRHFTWQALITARLGPDLARAVAEAQETGTPNAADSRIDRHNNAVGQEYGAAHAAELSALPMSEALEHLAEVGLEKWAAGDLLRVTSR